MRSGPVLDFVVGLALEYPGDIPGDGRTWFAFCRAELIRSGPFRCFPVVHRVARYDSGRCKAGLMRSGPLRFGPVLDCAVWSYSGWFTW